MPLAFTDYFKSIGIAKPILDRIDLLCEHIKTLLPGEDFTDVMVNDYIESDGTRRYSDIRFYSGKKIVIVNDFINTENIIITNRSKDILHVRFEAKDYDFKKATEKSRLHVVVLVATGQGDLNAAKENCDHLIEVVQKVYMPSMAIVE